MVNMENLNILFNYIVSLGESCDPSFLYSLNQILCVTYLTSKEEKNVNDLHKGE